MANHTLRITSINQHVQAKPSLTHDQSINHQARTYPQYIHISVCAIRQIPNIYQVLDSPVLSLK